MDIFDLGILRNIFSFSQFRNNFSLHACILVKLFTRSKPKNRCHTNRYRWGWHVGAATARRTARIKEPSTNGRREPKTAFCPISAMAVRIPRMEGVRTCNSHGTPSHSAKGWAPCLKQDPQARMHAWIYEFIYVLQAIIYKSMCARQTIKDWGAARPWTFPSLHLSCNEFQGSGSAKAVPPAPHNGSWGFLLRAFTAPLKEGILATWHGGRQGG